MVTAPRIFTLGMRISFATPAGDVHSLDLDSDMQVHYIDEDYGC